MALEIIGGSMDGMLLDHSGLQRVQLGFAKDTNETFFFNHISRIDNDAPIEVETYIIEGDKAIEQNLYRGMAR